MWWALPAPKSMTASRRPLRPPRTCRSCTRCPSQTARGPPGRARTEGSSRSRCMGLRRNSSIWAECGRKTSRARGPSSRAPGPRNSSFTTASSSSRRSRGGGAAEGRRTRTSLPCTSLRWCTAQSSLSTTGRSARMRTRARPRGAGTQTNTRPSRAPTSRAPRCAQGAISARWPTGRGRRGSTRTPSAPTCAPTAGAVSAACASLPTT
mmetsp:Transcript_21842/g.55183  ORF Transcript_21842/g.55183 Transcript_21842/m.55183 type:complete len:208 (+) Transcript_21842:787-1410(+)